MYRLCVLKTGRAAKIKIEFTHIALNLALTILINV